MMAGGDSPRGRGSQAQGPIWGRHPSPQRGVPAVILGLGQCGRGGPEGQGSCRETKVLGIWKPDWSGPWGEGAVRNETVGAANPSDFFFLSFYCFIYTINEGHILEHQLSSSSNPSLV